MERNSTDFDTKSVGDNIFKSIEDFIRKKFRHNQSMKATGDSPVAF